MGSIGCDRLLKGEVSARTVPFGALGMAVFSIDLYFASAGVTPAAAPALAEPLGALDFLGQAGHWRILADLLLVSMFGGLFLVPLYAPVQPRAEADSKARTIDATNILNALFLVLGAAGAALLCSNG